MLQKFAPLGRGYSCIHCFYEPLIVIQIMTEDLLGKFVSLEAALGRDFSQSRFLIRL